MHRELHKYQPQQCLTQAGDVAAVATRERCGRVETARERLGEDWPETVCALMSSICSPMSVCASAHTLTPSSINTLSRRIFARQGRQICLLFPFQSSIARPPTIIHVHTCRANRKLCAHLRSSRRGIRACRAQTTAATVG